MMFCIRGCIHIIFDPFVEHVRVDGTGAVIGETIAFEIVGVWCL